MRKLYRIFRRTWLNWAPWQHRVLFWSGAVVVGLAAVGFAIGSDHAMRAFASVVQPHPWLALIITPMGMGMIAYLTIRFVPEAKGSGIPQTIAALTVDDKTLRQRLLSVRIAFGKIVLTMFGLLCGASVGREGPTVQVGASIMYALDRLIPFPRRELERGFILAGSAAGVAAAFNTPLAGIVFAIEEMSRSYEQRTTGTVLTAVIIAGIVAIALQGNYTYFGHTTAKAESQAWQAVILCGLLGGLFGGLFSRIVIGVQKGVPGKLGIFMRTRPILFAMSIGLALALIGLLSDNSTYGTGYEQARAILEGQSQLPVTFGFLKLLATLISFLSGIPGGIFAPSLAVGAGMGANISLLIPSVPVGVVIILGMVAYFAGVIQAPITAFVIVMEMTAGHDLVVPLMAAALLAYLTSRVVCPLSLYATLANGFIPASHDVKPIAHS